MKSSVLRLLVGGLFLWSGVSKIVHPTLFAESIQGYALLPGRYVTLVAVLLPWLEAVVGAALLAGWRTRAAGVWVALLSTAFGGAIASAIWRGLDVSCGCFGESVSSRANAGHLLLNLVLVLSGCWLAWRGAESWSLDSRSQRARTLSPVTD